MYLIITECCTKKLPKCRFVMMLWLFTEMRYSGIKTHFPIEESMKDSHGNASRIWGILK